MNKAFYIVGIVFAVIFLFLGAYYSEEVSSAKWDSFFGDYSYNYSSSYDYGYSYGSSNYSNLDEEYTIEAGLWSIFFFLAFTAITLLGLLKIKTKTNKVLSIIGLSLTAIYLMWNFLMISSPGSISFDEVYPGWAMYCNIMLAFSIVGLVQSIRFAKRSKIPGGTTISDAKDLLDS